MSIIMRRKCILSVVQNPANRRIKRLINISMKHTFRHSHFFVPYASGITQHTNTHKANRLTYWQSFRDLPEQSLGPSNWKEKKTWSKGEGVEKLKKQYITKYNIRVVVSNMICLGFVQKTK